MKQWEPIAGSDIKVGNRVTWGSKTCSYRVIDVNNEEWVGTDREYLVEGFSSNVNHYPVRFLKRDTVGMVKLIEGTQYDPKQQPYEDTDI